MFKIWKLLKNKYLLTALVLAVWILCTPEAGVLILPKADEAGTDSAAGGLCLRGGSGGLPLKT